MNLNERIHRTAQRSTDSELCATFETLKAHVRYREPLKADVSPARRGPRRAKSAAGV